MVTLPRTDTLDPKEEKLRTASVDPSRPKEVREREEAKAAWEKAVIGAPRRVSPRTEMDLPRFTSSWIETVDPNLVCP
jgi:hypothetical protein